MIYTIFGGVNGAGKSTIFQLFSNTEKANLDVRINVDELVFSMGSWQDMREIFYTCNTFPVR